MTRHESHMARREVYAGDAHGVAFRTGGQHRRYKYDVLDAAQQQQRLQTHSALTQSALLRTPAVAVEAALEHDRSWSATAAQAQAEAAASESASGPEAASDPDSDSGDFQQTERFFWYMEHTSPGLGEGNETALDEMPLLYGGIMACSTADFRSWRHEGTMLHFANMSYDGGVPRLRVDVHGGVDGLGLATAGERHDVEVAVEEVVGEGNWSDAALFAERPKVLFNNATGKFVMWAEAQDRGAEIGLAAVATADFPGGPFELHDVMLPDGNETKDQTVFAQPDGKAYLVRTYYATVDYVLPEPVMQPLWESVKGENGEVDYGVNYHRSIYKDGYDNSDDICIQRLRKEHLEAEIVELPDDERVPVERWIKNAYTGEGILELFVLEEQAEPWVTRTVLGQGDPVLESRFKHPNMSANSVWLPSSVPAVKAQSWSNNYLDDNIADNVVHAALPDKLIGPPQVVEQRRAKYIAVSLLADDYLNVSGTLTVFEGSLEDGQDLASALSDLNLFDLSASEGSHGPLLSERRFFPAACEGGAEDDEWEDCNDAPLQPQESTAPGQVWGLSEPFNFRTEYDWAWRYHQYRWAPNDRADAPLNFADQLIDWFEPGRGDAQTTRGREKLRSYDHNCYRGPTTQFDEDDENYVPADDLFNHELSQHYTKTEGADIASTTAHLFNI